MLIRIAGTVSESIVDGPGIRYTIFTQGCPHHCEGCHNPETHDFSGGRLKGVTFSGGEPFCQPAPLYDLAKRIKENTKLDIMAYTGFTFEQLVEKSKTDEDVKNLLSVVDILVDGKFILAQRSLELHFKGSRNQIDCKKSLETGNVVIKEL